MKSCWIFSGAPVKDDYRIIPPNDAYLIAADSGYSILKRIGITPDLVLGDFDSLNEAVSENCEILSVSAEKDDTDTMLAVKTALSKGYDDITIVGSIGGRLDHTFANIQTLAFILDNGKTGRLVGEYDTVELLNCGKYTFQRQENMYFSIFAYSKSAIVTIKGTKYNLTDYCLTNTFPLGVSNEIIDDNCTVQVNDGQILVIFSNK